MSLTTNVAFKLIELFENPDESVMRLAGDTPVLAVGHCCCCCCCHCHFRFGAEDSDCNWEEYASAEGYDGSDTSVEPGYESVESVAN
jgi:hypothetical protein